ncbi:MAG: sel1 repeat family protein [Lysobacter sp.]|nr:sel1 repeat family protein [Lysobacter sp.]
MRFMACIAISFLFGALASFLFFLLMPAVHESRLRYEMKPAVRLMKAGEFRRAAEVLQPLAEEGNHFAQREFGVILALGAGVDEDSQRAIGLLRKAECRCEPGSGELKVAFEYKNGGMVAPDEASYRLWLRRAADSGNIKAQELFGKMELQED